MLLPWVVLVPVDVVGLLPTHKVMFSAGGRELHSSIQVGHGLFAEAVASVALLGFCPRTARPSAGHQMTSYCR